MKTYKELVEGINETLSFFLGEEVELVEGPTHLEYGGYVGKKEYKVKVPQHKELGDYSEKGLHRKISKENPHLHHHEVTAIVNSGGEEESHEKVEHEGKTHTHKVFNRQEPRHIYEGVEGIQELSKDTLKSYTTKRTMGVDSSGSTNPNTISSMKRKAKANSTLGNDAEAARLRTKAKNSSNSTAKAFARMGDKGMPGSAVDKAAKKMPASYRKEEVEQTDEELKGNQHKIDANKNGKVDGHDFKILRNAKKARYQ